MFSTLLEVVGFAAITAATYILAGLPAALYAAGAFALLAGYATEDEKALIALSRAVRPLRLRVLAVRLRKEQRKRRRELAKAE